MAPCVSVLETCLLAKIMILSREFLTLIRVPWLVCSSREPARYKAHTMGRKNQPAMFRPAFVLQPEIGKFRVSTALHSASVYSGNQQ